jgi:hypothetical protein
VNDVKTSYPQNTFGANTHCWEQQTTIAGYEQCGRVAQAMQVLYPESSNLIGPDISLYFHPNISPLTEHAQSMKL